MARTRVAGLPAGGFLLTMLAGVGAPVADPQPMTAGTNPQPTTSTQVAIAREELVIDIKPDWAEVGVALWLENRGKATRFQVGFPCDVDPEENVSTLPCKTRLDVAVDGKRVRPVERPTSKQVHDWVWPMRFGAGGKVRLDIAYRAPLVNDRYDHGLWGMEALVYRLLTGAAWAGPIGQLEIEVHTPTDGLAFIAPRGYTRSPGKIRWSLADFEPNEDLVLVFAGSALLVSQPEGLAEWERISHVERALSFMLTEPERLSKYMIPLRLFGSRWQTDVDAFRRHLDESAALLETRLPLGWKLFKQRLVAAGGKIPVQEAERLYVERQLGTFWSARAQAAESTDLVAAADRMARFELDAFESDPWGAVYVAVARALGGDARGAERIRDGVADGPPLEVAKGLAALELPVCPLIAEQLPEEWEIYVKRTSPPPIEPGTFELSRALAQKQARLRLLQLTSEGTDGDCLAFVKETAASKSVSAEEREVAQAILRRGKPAPDGPSLDELDRRLRSPDFRVRTAAVRALAGRRDAPAAKFRRALRHSDSCAARMLAGATRAEAEKAKYRWDCERRTFGTIYSALLAVGEHRGAAELLPDVLRWDETEGDRIAHVGEWLAARRVAAADSR